MWLCWFCVEIMSATHTPTTQPQPHVLRLCHFRECSQAGDRHRKAEKAQLPVEAALDRAHGGTSAAWIAELLDAQQQLLRRQGWWLSLQQVSADAPGLICPGCRGIALGTLLFTYGLLLGTCSHKNTMQILAWTCKHLSLGSPSRHNEPELSPMFPRVLCTCKS